MYFQKSLLKVSGIFLLQVICSLQSNIAIAIARPVSTKDTLDDKYSICVKLAPANQHAWI